MEDEIKKLIAENKVMIFSKDYCPFCHKTMDLFRNNGVEDFHAVQMDKIDNGGAMHDALKAF